MASQPEQVLIGPGTRRPSYRLAGVSSRTAADSSFGGQVRGHSRATGGFEVDRCSGNNPSRFVRIGTNEAIGTLILARSLRRSHFWVPV